MQLATEIWEDVIGYEGLYQVSSWGQIKSMEKTIACGRYYGRIIHMPERIIRGTLSKDGYRKVRLYNNGAWKIFSVHQLVIKAFVDEVEDKLYCNHKNGVKTCNYSWNLEWVTQYENIHHAYSIGLIKHPKGEELGKNVILKEKDIKYIRNLYDSGGMTYKSIGIKYGVTKHAIFRVCKKLNWKHIA